MVQDQESIETYIQHIYKRGIMLIRNGLWDGIDPLRFKAWFNNFTSVEERLLAALLVDRLIYRSQKHMISMLFDLFTISIPNCMRLGNDPNYQQNRRLLTRLCENRDNQIRLVNINEDDQPSQSSGEIINIVNHQMNIKRRNLIYQKDIFGNYQNGARTFILIDDMICTGEQMCSALDKIGINKYPECCFYIAVCCACKDGIVFIHKKYPNIQIAYTELLTKEEHSFFYSIDEKKIPLEVMSNLKDFYEKFTIGKKFNKQQLYGKGNMALVYAFQNSTPNASLPILYYKTNSFNQFLNKRGS